jgi:tripeptidyl-peptidase-1
MVLFKWKMMALRTAPIHKRTEASDKCPIRFTSTMVALRSLVSLVALVTLALAEPKLSRSILHEKRATSNLLGWTRLERHASDAALPLRFGLRQRNLDKLDDFLLAVSNPDSPNYG